MVYTPRDSQFLVNTLTVGLQWQPRVVTLSDGRVLAVWGSPTTAQGSNYTIHGQFFDPDGEKIGGEMFLTHLSGTVSAHTAPSLAAIPGGGFVLAWTGIEGSVGIVRAQYFDATGAEASAEAVLGPRSTMPSGMAHLANGSVVMAWNINDGDGLGIGGTILAPDGTHQDFSVTGNTIGNQQFPSVTVLANGNFIVSWGDEDLGKVLAQIFNNEGTKLGAEFQINTTILGTQEQPDLLALPLGGFVAVWIDGSSPPNDSQDIRGQLFDSGGGKVGPEFLVHSSSEGHQFSPQVSLAQDGGFVVTWNEQFVPGDIGIKAQQFASDGTKVGSEFVVPNITVEYEVQPSVAMLGNGDLFFLWGDSSRQLGDTSRDAIMARLFTTATPGTEGPDTISGTAGDDRWIALGGDDFLLMQQGGNEDVDGGAGNDTFYFGNAYTADDRVDGGAGNDRLILQGQYGNLQLNAPSLVNVETILLLTAANAAFGGAGANPTFYSIASADANLAGGSSMAVDGRQLANEYLNFYGSAETDGAFFLYGGAAADTLTGGAGRDTLDGGAGNDTLAGGGNDDIYFVDHPGDVVLEAVGGGGFDAVYAGINYVLRAGSEIEQLAATGLALGRAIDLTGNEFSQSLVSGSGHDALNGGGGADFLTANAGNDILNGGTGVDYMDGGAGDDIYYVDDVFDTVIEHAGGGNDSVYASATYQLSGGAQVELLATTGLALGQAITLFGNDFAQSIIGATGNDILYGFGGADSIVGNEGNDTLDGGGGNDVLRGGLGLDTFVFSSVADSTGAGDAVLDFLNAVDKIDLSLIDANVNVPGNHAFTYIGTSAFSNVAGQLRVELSGGLVNVLGDVDGDGLADLIIHLYNTGGLVPTAGDFIL